MLVQVHYGEILCYDTSLPRSAGPIVRVPVTYLSPSTTASTVPSAAEVSAPLRHVFNGLTFSPGQIHRKIIHVPAGASRYTVSLRGAGSWGGGDNGANNRMLVLHCQQLVPQRAHRDSMMEKYLWFNRTTSKQFVGQCFPGFAMEVVVAQFNTSNVGDSSADVIVEFAGVHPHVSSFNAGVTLESEQGFTRLDVTAPYGATPQYLSPKVDLTHFEQQIHPEQYSICSSTERTSETPFSRNAPTADGKPVYVMTLKYSFTVDVAAPYSIHAGAVSEILYENPFGAQMRVIYDSNNRQVGATDALANSYPTEKLEKGKYTIRLALRHPDVSKLEGKRKTCFSCCIVLMRS